MEYNIKWNGLTIDNAQAPSFTRELSEQTSTPVYRVLPSLFEDSGY